MENTKQRAELSYILGIVSLISCFFLTRMNICLPISGIILSHFVKREAQMIEIDENIQKKAKTGFTLSVISLILMPFVLFINILISLLPEIY